MPFDIAMCFMGRFPNCHETPRTAAPPPPEKGVVKEFGWAYKSDPVGARYSASVLG